VPSDPLTIPFGNVAFWCSYNASSDMEAVYITLARILGFEILF